MKTSSQSEIQGSAGLPSPTPSPSPLPTPSPNPNPAPAPTPTPLPTPEGTFQAECNQASILTAIAAAKVDGGVVTFNCRNTTITMAQGLGSIGNNVIVDGEDRNITLEYTTNFSGCVVGDGTGPEIADLDGSSSAVRNLTFRNYMESLQISGANNYVENNRFIAHECSDDGLSTITVAATGTVVRNNYFEGYNDKAFQMSYGGGLIEGNTFVDSMQPIRSPYDNSAGEAFHIVNNIMRTTGTRTECNGPHIDGTYEIYFTGNTVECYRGVRIGGATQIVFENNIITGNPRGGVLLKDNAVGTFTGNRIENNGASPGSEPAAGVAVTAAAQADLSGGRNILRGNGTRDLRNLRLGYTVQADNNCWDHTSEQEILSLDTEGSVTVAGASCN